MLILSRAWRLALGPTQPSIQWVPRLLTRGNVWPEHEVDNSPLYNAEVKSGATPPLLLYAFIA